MSNGIYKPRRRRMIGEHQPAPAVVENPASPAAFIPTLDALRALKERSETAQQALKEHAEHAFLHGPAAPFKSLGALFQRAYVPKDGVRLDQYGTDEERVAWRNQPLPDIFDVKTGKMAWHDPRRRLG